MNTIMDNSAALSQFAQTVPDNGGLVLAAQDTRTSSDGVNFMLVGVGLTVVVAAAIIIVALRSKRRRSAR